MYNNSLCDVILQKVVPEAVQLYNKGMGGVDVADQMIDYYSAERKTVKMWKKIVFHLLDRTLLNAYILYKVLPGSGFNVLPQVGSPYSVWAHSRCRRTTTLNIVGFFAGTFPSRGD